MKYKGLCICMLLVGSVCGEGRVNIAKGRRVVVDKIVARVNGRNVLLSHIKEPRIDKIGQSYTLKESIENELLFQKAANRKLLPTSLDVDKSITSWKVKNNLDDLDEAAFEKRLRRDGLTGKIYRRQLGRLIAINNLRHVEVSERVIVTAREVEERYKANPPYQDERYTLQTIIVADKEHKPSDKDEWIDVDWIEKSELQDNMRFIAKMEEGSISKAIPVGQGFQFIKLVKKEKKRLKTLEEAWGDIEDTIKNEKMETFEKEYVAELRSKASIVYL